MRLYVQGAEDFWTATMVGEDEPPPTPGVMQGVCFFGRTPEEAKAYLGLLEPKN